MRSMVEGLLNRSTRSQLYRSLTSNNKNWRENPSTSLR